MYKPPDLNFKGLELRNAVQEDIATKDDNNLIVEAYTGFGKTWIGAKRIKHLLLSKPNLEVHIVVPKEHLATSWADSLLPLQNEFPFLNVQIYIINSYTMNNKAPHCDLLIIDEVHRALNESSEYFSTAIEQSYFNYSLFLTATLKEQYEKYLIDELKKKGKQVVKYQITLYWGFKQGLVPATKILNVPLELTLREKSDYIQAQSLHKKYSSYFAAAKVYAPYDYINKAAANQRAFIAKELNQQEGAIYGMLLKWNKALNDRKMIIQNASSKFTSTLSILNVLNEKTLVFCKTIDFANNVVKDNCRAIAYHSKLTTKKSKGGLTQKEQVLESFYSEQTPFLVSIDSLKEGFDVTSCQIALRVAYTSNDLDTVQQLGRIIRFDENNPNKEPIMINLFIDDFKLGGDVIQSQEKVWLSNSLKNQTSEVIELNELIKYLKLK